MGLQASGPDSKNLNPGASTYYPWACYLNFSGAHCLRKGREGGVTELRKYRRAVISYLSILDNQSKDICI